MKFSGQLFIDDCRIKRCASLCVYRARCVMCIHILLELTKQYTRFDQSVSEHPSMTTLFTHSMMVLLMLILFIVVDVFSPVASITAAVVSSLFFLASVRLKCDANAYAHILFNFLLVIFIDSYLLIEKESECATATSTSSNSSSSSNLEVDYLAATIYLNMYTDSYYATIVVK